MREITAPTALLSPTGALDPAALGFSRRPLHTVEGLPRGLFHGWRTKCWDRWVVVTPEVLVGLTVADLDLGALVRIMAVDRATGHEIDQSAVRIPTPRDAVDLPTGLPPFFARGTLGELSLRFDAAAEDRTVLRAETARVSLVIEVDAAVESLSTALSLGPGRYRYSVNRPGLPATGLVVLDGGALPVEHGWAALQRTRGRFPRRTRHLFSCGAGIGRTGERIALVLSGPDTVGTDPARPARRGTTSRGPAGAAGSGHAAAGSAADAALQAQQENALFRAGRLLGPRPGVTWSIPENPDQPWEVTGEWIEATLHPWHTRTAGGAAGLVRERLTQTFGTWSGHAAVEGSLADGGESVDLDGLTGWVERSDRHW